MDAEGRLIGHMERAHTLGPGAAPGGLVDACGFGGHSVALVIPAS